MTTFNVNYTANMYICEHFLKERMNAGGAITFVTSMSGIAWRENKGECDYVLGITEWDAVQEKMKEINDAYSTITKARSEGTSGTQSSYSGQSGQHNSYGAYSRQNTYSSGQASEAARVRAAINSGNIALAESLLKSMPIHDAEWNFLMGSVYYRKGWLDEARNYYQIAVNMDPANIEYRQALNYMSSGGRAYRPAGYPQGNMYGCDGCDVCSSLLIADCCCECLGGDLIRCC